MVSILGKKNVNGNPRIDAITPSAALPGAEVRIVGSGLKPPELSRPRVQFAGVEGDIIISSERFLVARVPEDAHSGDVVVASNSYVSNPFPVRVAVPIADGLHPVANPAIDAEGNIYATFSGSRGQKTPISIYKIDPDYKVKPFVTELTNATAMAFDRDGYLYASSRFDGTVYRISPSAAVSAYAQGMGVATGLAFDREENLYVGDRSGTIFKIARDRQIFVFATLEPSIAAYHLAFSPAGDLYVTGPTTSSFDSVYKVDPHGQVSVFYRGLGRPQGIAFDEGGNLYVAASLNGKQGIVRITPAGEASLAVSGRGLVGLCFGPGRSTILATNHAVHYLSWDVQGRVLYAF